MRNSHVVQEQSLIRFMEALGYKVYTVNRGFVFITTYKENKGFRAISFANAVKLHNKCDDVEFVDEFNVQLPNTNFVFPAYTFQQAAVSRVVERVYLSVRNKEVEVDKHWVKFTNFTEKLFFPLLGEEFPEVDITKAYEE